LRYFFNGIVPTSEVFQGGERLFPLNCSVQLH
jgi:hypothetical protein